MAIESITLNSGSGGASIPADKETSTGYYYPAGIVAFGADGGPYTIVSTASGAGLPVQPSTNAYFPIGAYNNLSSKYAALVQDGSGALHIKAPGGLEALNPTSGDLVQLRVDDATSGLLVFPVGTATVAGSQAHDTAAIDFPLRISAYASTSAPTAVSADGDVVNLWADRNGRLQIGDGGSTISIDDGGGSVTVDGTVAATQSGTWSSRTQDGSGNSLTSATRGSEQALSVQIVDSSGNQITSFGGSGGTASNYGSAFPSSGTASGFSDGTNMQGARVFDADSGAGTQYVLGTILRKSASGGSVEAGTSSDPLRTDPTGTTAQPITDNSGSLTVDAPVGTPVFVRLSDGSSAISTLPVSIAATVTISGTVTANAGTNLNTSALALESGGNLATIAGAVRAEDTASADAHVGIGALAIRKATPANTSGTDGDYEFLQMSAGRLWASATIDAALPAGTNNIGDVDVLSIAAGDNNIGNVDIVTMPNVTLAAGTNTNEVVGDAAHDAAVAGNPLLVGAYASAAAPTDVSADGDATRLWCLRNGALTVQQTFAGVLASTGNGASGTGVLRVTVANDSTGILAGVTTVTTVTTCSTLTGGGVAHDGADSGNPVKIGVKATTSLSAQTMVANADRTDLFAGADGALIVRPHCNLEDVVQERTTNTDGASTAFASGLGAPGAGIRLWIKNVTICNSSASFCTVDLRDGAAGSVLWTLPVPATGGVTHVFDPPLKLTANTALAFDASAATSTLTISANGFKSKL